MELEIICHPEEETVLELVTRDWSSVHTRRVWSSEIG